MAWVQASMYTPHHFRLPDVEFSWYETFLAHYKLDKVDVPILELTDDFKEPFIEYVPRSNMTFVDDTP